MFGTSKVITLEAAKKMVAAGEAEAVKNGWNVAITIVDASGGLILFHKLDETQPGSIHVSQGKARTSALFKRPTKAFEEALASGKQGILSLQGAVPLDGGIPLVVGDKIVGAIGVSGATSAQDGQCATVGVAALEGKPAAKPVVKK